MNVSGNNTATPASAHGNIHVPGMGTVDMNSVLAMGIIQMVQMQMHWMQNVQGCGAAHGTIPAGLTSLQTGTLPSKPIHMYPKFDAFFEALSLENVDWDMGSILMVLADASIHCIHELEEFSDKELIDLGLKIGDIKWLRKVVRKALMD